MATLAEESISLFRDKLIGYAFSASAVSYFLLFNKMNNVEVLRAIRFSDFDTAKRVHEVLKKGFNPNPHQRETPDYFSKSFFDMKDEINKYI